LLAQEVAAGLRESGHDAALHYVDDFLPHSCAIAAAVAERTANGTIEDGFRPVFLEQYLRRKGSSPHPYLLVRMSAQLKAFFDRMFCDIAASSRDRPSGADARKADRTHHVSEETFPTVSAGIVHQIQEFARYTRSNFVGSICGSECAG